MTKLFTAAAATVIVIAALALTVVTVKGQTVRSRPFADFKTQILGGSNIGVTVRDVEDADLKREKLATLAGVVVEEVEADGPAAKAGMKAGDVIVTFDAEKVRSARHLARLVEETPEGREVEATVLRAGAKVSMKMAPVATGMFARYYGRMPEFRSTERFVAPKLNPRIEMPKIDPPSGFFRRYGWSGVTVQDLTGQLGDYFGTREGVLVTSVEDSSAAKTLGLKAGDVITRINDYAIGSSADWWRRMPATPGDVTITIMRDRKELTLKGKIE